VLTGLNEQLRANKAFGVADPVARHMRQAAQQTTATVHVANVVAAEGEHGEYVEVAVMEQPQ
jgi:hypothetical protein